jgi:uncharacterized repeat protein (TIGR03847 family)
MVPRQLHVFDPPDRFVAGTVGQPGERTFYLQAIDGVRVVNVALEKVQVSALAERIDELLAEVRRRAGEQAAQAEAEPTEAEPTEAEQPEDVAPLQTPLLEDFRAGTLALAWDEASGQVVVEAQAAAAQEDEPAETAPFDDESGEGPDTLRVHLVPAAARAFARRAARVVAAGRPPCPLCGQPLDPEGHICPRQNGHRG